MAGCGQQHQQHQQNTAICLPPDEARELLLRGEAPAGMHVDGDLDLRGCSRLTSLGDGLSVGGTLALRGCSALTSLGDGLSVGGHLDLEGCSALQERHRGDMGAFFEQLSAVLGPKAGLSLTGWEAVEHMPDGFSVGGALIFWKCSALTSLGDGLSVGDDLVLRDCSALTSLGDGLSVGGNLSLTCCYLLANLGDGLSVRGDLGLQFCSALADLPRGLSVGGYLNLYGCSALQEQHRSDMGAFFEQLSAALGPKAGLSLSGWEAVAELPDGFCVGAEFDLDNCSALTNIGDSLSVGGILRLYGCSALTKIGVGLSVGDSLYVPRSSALVSLGDGLSVGGTLDLEDCSALESLPDGLSVGGLLSLTGCSALQERHRGDMGAFFEQLSAVLGPNAGLSLARWDAVEHVPDGFSVGGDLDLCWCTALTSLGEGLSVGGDLHLLSCSAITSLPASLIKVSGTLDLARCQKLTSVPDGLDVDGDLDLACCWALTSLPTSLRVKGTLDLDECTALKAQHQGNMEAFLVALRESIGPSGGLRLCGWTTIRELPVCYADIGGELDLSGCTALTRLPEDLHCTSLETLPASILEWPTDENGNPHDIYLGGSGLSAETLEWLGEADAPGLRFHVDLFWGGQSEARPGFSSAAEAAAFWSSESQVDAVAVPPGTDDATLVRFLSRLRDAKEFGIAETRNALAKRVVDVLELLTGDDEHVREELLLRMADSLDACGDKPVWALNQMYLVVEIAKARESAEQLRELGRRVMRLMVVHEHAKRKVDSLRWVDDVCVYLRFEIDLREALDLPVAATAMIFPSYIKIEDAELEAAKDDALAITDAQFEAWLAEWPEWQRHERHQVVAELRWQALAVIKQQHSLRKRMSRRLSQLVSVVGDKLVDPVTLDGGKSVWSLRDLLRHWERTGLDLHNAPVSVEQLRSDLKRVVA